MSQWNWYNFESSQGGYAAPTAGDDLYFVGYQSPGETSPGGHTYLPAPITPGSPEYMMMMMQGMPVNEPLRPNADVTIPISSLPTVRGIHLVSHYSAHVSVYSGQQLGTLDLQTGNLDQIGAGSHLYIGYYLGFLGGTLNSTSNLGSVVHLTGNISSPGEVATANLESLLSPLTIGSTVSVEGLGTATTGSGLAQWAGNYLFTNGAGLYVGEFCNAQVGKPGVGQLNGTYVSATDPAVGTSILVDNAAVVTSFGNYNLAGKIRVLTGGTFRNTTGAIVTVTSPANNISFSVATAANNKPQGTLILEEGSQLVVNRDLEVAGKLAVEPVKFGGEDRTTALINGDVGLFLSSTLSLLSVDLADPARTLFPALGVSGDMDIKGLCLFDVNANDRASASYLDCAGTLTFWATATMTIRVRPQCAALTSGWAWSIMTSLNAIAGPVPTMTADSAIRFVVTKEGQDKFLQARYI